MLAGVSRVHVLETLRAQDRPITVADVAGRVGLHSNTVRLHLDHLVDAGLATRKPEERGRPGRPRLVYAATSPEPDGYRLLAEVLAGGLGETAVEPEKTATEVGRGWGRALARGAGSPPGDGGRTDEAATAQVVSLLDDIGFAPHPTDTGTTIELHRCPFLQVAEKHSEVVCSIHLGLMQGAFTELGAAVQTTRLEPFAVPGLCLAQLDRTEPASKERKPE